MPPGPLGVSALARPRRSGAGRLDAAPPASVRRALSAALAGLALAVGACVVGNPPWIAPTVRILYHAEGTTRGGIRFLVAREANEIAITREPADAEPAYDRREGWVYFSSAEAGRRDLFRARLSGEERTPVTRTPEADERWPALARDGGALFYTSDAGGTEQIWRSAPDGSNPEPVTRGPEPHSRAAADSAGVWLVAVQGDSASGRLVRIELTTGAVTPVEGVGDLAPLGRPAVRADGAIVYVCRARSSTDICRLDPGKPARRLTEDGPRDRDPAWSPSGGSVVFSSDREGGDFELYAMRQDGSGMRRLTKQKGVDVEPAWVP